MIIFILIVGGTFLSFLTTVAFLQHYLLLGAVDLIILGFVIILFIRVRKSTDTKQLEFIGTIGIGLFYSFLIAYGGVNTTAFMWAFTYPLISLSLLGPRLGRRLPELVRRRRDTGAIEAHDTSLHREELAPTEAVRREDRA